MAEALVATVRSLFYRWCFGKLFEVCRQRKDVRLPGMCRVDGRWLTVPAGSEALDRLPVQTLAPPLSVLLTLGELTSLCLSFLKV